MVTEARKRANAKWDKENMIVLACKVKRETAEQFKAACAEQGTTTNAVLQRAVRAVSYTHLPGGGFLHTKKGSAAFCRRAFVFYR